MSRAERSRSQLLALERAVRFQRFILHLEDGTRILIKHPHDIAMDPEPNAKE